MKQLKNILRKYSDLMTVDEVREALHIGRSMMYKLLKNGELRSLRIGAKYRIPKTFLLEFLNENA